LDCFRGASVLGVGLEGVAAGQDGVVTAAQCLAAGLGRDDVARLCRSGRWRRVFRGAYFVDDQSPDVPMRARIRAALLTLGPGAVATLTSAAHLLELPYVPPDAAVHVATPAALRRRDQQGLVVRQLVIAEADVTRLAGMRVTTPVRTVADLLLALHRQDAIAIIDGALREGRLAVDDIEAVRGQLRRRRGVVRVRPWLDHVDGRAESPLETRIRVICTDAGLRPETLQHVIRDADGYILAVADLAWPSRRLLVEADGAAVHSSLEALYHDRRRQNALIAQGYTILRFTWEDTRRPGYVVSAVRAALAAAPQPVPRPLLIRDLVGVADGESCHQLPDQLTGLSWRSPCPGRFRPFRRRCARAPRRSYVRRS